MLCIIAILLKIELPKIINTAQKSLLIAFMRICICLIVPVYTMYVFSCFFELPVVSVKTMPIDLLTFLF